MWHDQKKSTENSDEPETFLHGFSIIIDLYAINRQTYWFK